MSDTISKTSQNEAGQAAIPFLRNEAIFIHEALGLVHQVQHYGVKCLKKFWQFEHMTQLQKMEEHLSKYCDQTLPGLIKLISWKSQQISNTSPCLHVVQALYEYREFSLQDLKKAKKRSKTSFTQDEIYQMIKSVCQGLIALQEMGRAHGDIRPGTILQGDNSQWLLGDAILFNNSTAFLDCAIRNDDTKLSYLSPSCLQALNSSQLPQDINWMKNDIFALGMVALEIAVDKSSKDKYVEKINGKYMIQYQKIISDIHQIVKVKYSLELAILINNMLLANENERSTAQDILNQIEQPLLNRQKVKDCRKSAGDVSVPLISQRDQLFTDTFFTSWLTKEPRTDLDLNDKGWMSSRSHYKAPPYTSYRGEEASASLCIDRGTKPYQPPSQFLNEIRFDTATANSINYKSNNLVSRPTTKGDAMPFLDQIPLLKLNQIPDRPAQILNDYGYPIKGEREHVVVNITFNPTQSSQAKYTVDTQLENLTTRMGTIPSSQRSQDFLPWTPPHSSSNQQNTVDSAKPQKTENVKTDAKKEIENVYDTTESIRCEQEKLQSTSSKQMDNTQKTPDYTVNLINNESQTASIPTSENATQISGQMLIPVDLKFNDNEVIGSTQATIRDNDTTKPKAYDKGFLDRDLASIQTSFLLGSTMDFIPACTDSTMKVGQPQGIDQPLEQLIAIRTVKDSCTDLDDLERLLRSDPIPEVIQESDENGPNETFQSAHENEAQPGIIGQSIHKNDLVIEQEQSTNTTVPQIQQEVSAGIAEMNQNNISFTHRSEIQSSIFNDKTAAHREHVSLGRPLAHKRTSQMNLSLLSNSPGRVRRSINQSSSSTISAPVIVTVQRLTGHTHRGQSPDVSRLLTSTMVNR